LGNASGTLTTPRHVTYLKRRQKARASSLAERELEVFVARQPIFNRSEQVYAYELLFRSSWSNYFQSTESDLASMKVIANSFFLLGIEAITRGKRAFVNFTRDTLIQGYAALLPKEQLVVELVESVEPDPTVMAACETLKKAGYLLALDNFFHKNTLSPLIPLADFIKVDFQATSSKQRKLLADAFVPRGINLIAAKVESDGEFAEAISFGYSYMQGYFFCRPVIVSGSDVPGTKVNYLRLLEQINQPQLDFDQIDGIIRREVSLSYKLLRYINSVAFGVRREVTTVRQALLLLGEMGIKKWFSVIILSDMGMDKPSEVVVTSVARARFCEFLAERGPLRERRNDAFLMGLFSLMDVIVGRPLAEVLADLPVAADLKAALLGEQNALREIFETVTAYENGDWDHVAATTARLKLGEQELPEMYRRAVEWGGEESAEAA
jgi:c-di-GMP-related signal transduction protein